MMKVYWAQTPLPKTSVGPSIFLAGPTPRSPHVDSWRPEAINLLENTLGFTGEVFIPESEGYIFKGTYDEQIIWEQNALELAACILFWVPRDLQTMPAFTTNIEFGRWYSSGKVVLGYPPKAPKMSYFKYVANQHGIPVANTLIDTLANAIRLSTDLLS